MRRFLFAAAGLLAAALVPASVHAQACPGMNVHLRAYAKEALTITNAAPVALTQSVYNAGGAVPLVALVTVSTATINAIDDGTAPSTGVPPAGAGQPYAAGEHLLICLTSIGTFRAIAQGANAAISVTYYRAP